MDEIAKSTNKKLQLWHWILIGCAAIVIIAVIVAIFYNPPIPELPDEFKNNVIAVIDKEDATDKFAVSNIELLRSGTIQITVSLNQSPQTANFISINVKNFIDKIELAYNYDLDLAISIVQPIPNTDKFRYYGRGSFYTNTGKIEFEPAK